MRLNDMHLHTNASDGKLTPTEVIQLAVKESLRSLAITDHDTLSGVRDFMNTGKMYGIETFAGVELSLDQPGISHMVAWGLNMEGAGILRMKELLEKNQEEREIKTLVVVEKLNSIDVPVSYKDILAVSTGDMVGKSQIAEAIVLKGYAKSIAEACDLYLNPGRPAYVKKNKTSPKVAIDLSHDAGALAVKAHPCFPITSYDKVEENLKELAAFGLDAVEVFCTEHNVEDRKFLLEVAKKLNLTVSGGSDFHGRPESGIYLGKGRNNNVCIPYEIVEELKERRKEVRRKAWSDNFEDIVVNVKQ